MSVILRFLTGLFSRWGIGEMGSDSLIICIYTMTCLCILFFFMSNWGLKMLFIILLSHCFYFLRAMCVCMKGPRGGRGARGPTGKPGAKVRSSIVMMGPFLINVVSTWKRLCRLSNILTHDWRMNPSELYSNLCRKEFTALKLEANKWHLVAFKTHGSPLNDSLGHKYTSDAFSFTQNVWEMKFQETCRLWNKAILFCCIKYLYCGAGVLQINRHVVSQSFNRSSCDNKESQCSDAAKCKEGNSAFTYLKHWYIKYNDRCSDF